MHSAGLMKVLIGLSVVCRSAMASPKVVQMDFSRRGTAGSLAKRATASVQLGNDESDGLYFVNALVGTPGQNVSLQIDTGSSDVWMFGPNSCNTSTSLCEGGDFDVTKSSSAKILSKGNFSIQYETPGSGVTGDYFTDNFNLGSLTVTNLTMAYATNASYVPTGIMGIGYDTDESIVAQGSSPYPSIIDQMKNEGLINSRAYSLWLNDLNATYGSILFGGYDKSKYSGTLVALPVQTSSDGKIDSFTVAWTSLSLTDPKKGTTNLTESSFIAPAILDSGTTLTLVPTQVYEALAEFADAVPTSDGSSAYVSCSELSNYKGTLNFGFGGTGGPIIKVPFAQLALPTYDSNGNPLTFRDGSQACQFGIGPSPDDGVILFGDTFLRSAYVIYDLDNNEIAIAPVVYGNAASNVVEFGSGGLGGVASSVSSAPTVTQTASKNVIPGVGGKATTSAVASAAPTAALSGFSSLTGLGIGATATGSSTASASATGSAKNAASGGVSVQMMVCALVSGFWMFVGVILL